MIVFDEFGNKVYGLECRYPVFDLRSDYVELVKRISDKYRRVCELNETYADVISECKDSCYSLGNVLVKCRDSISEKTRLVILQNLACYDIGRVERVASWLKTGVPFVRKYMDLFHEIMYNFHTDESLIPIGYSFAMYYDVEYDYICETLNPFRSLRGDFDVCRLTVNWDLDRGLCGKSRLRLFYSVYGSFQLSYSIQELDDAIIFAKSHRKDLDVFDWMADKILSDANGVCSVCGRHVSKCGPLSVYSLDIHHIVFVDNFFNDFEHGMIEDPACSDNTICALCSDCIDIMLREMDDRVAYANRFLYLLRQDYCLDDYSEVLTAFRKSVSEFCLEKMQQGFPVRYEPGVVCRDYMKRRFTEDERDVRFTYRCFDGFVNVCNTFLLGLRSLFVKQKCSLGCLVKKRFEALNRMTLRCVYDVKFSYRVSEVFGDGVTVGSVDDFKILCKQRVSDVLELADKIISNRRVSDAYHKEFCTLMSEYRCLRCGCGEKNIYKRYKSDCRAIQRMYLKIPVRCFVTFCVPDGRFGRLYGCSVEYMCELAGLKHLMSSYMPNSLTVENRLF